MRTLTILLLFLLSWQSYGQSLFENAVNTESVLQENYELNGCLRGVVYAGHEDSSDQPELKSTYAEAALKLKVRSRELGDAFAELRFCSGYLFDEQIEAVELREAYINTYPGPFDFRLGRQIVVWGRADGFNPTNNITPMNMLIRSPEEDDRREGNFLLRSFFNLQPLRLETVWIPLYEASVMPYSIMSLDITESNYPDPDLRHSGFAVKLNLELPALDGSLSYFNGYNPQPGLDLDPSANIIPTAYRMHVAGADFSTTLASIGLRGEVAFRYPFEDYESNIYIPNPDLQYVGGLEYQMGDLSIIFQYIGRYVLDYSELPELLPPAIIIALKNRIFSGQQNRASHALSLRPALQLLHETLTLELFSYYNLTTEELYLRPKLSYDMADALSLVLGADFYSGPDDTAYGMIDKALSAFFVELIASF